MNFNHKTPIQIRFNDIDVAGHVYNAVYQEYFDMARIEYFKKVLNDDLRWDETGLVIVSIQTDFSSRVYLDDKIEILSRVTFLGDKSLQMQQLVMKSGEKEPVAKGNTVLVCFDMQKNVSISVPKTWRKKLVGFEPDLIGD